jgi:hypothetical protein
MCLSAPLVPRPPAGLAKIAAANRTSLPHEPLADAPQPAGGKLRLIDILKVGGGGRFAVCLN